MQDIYPSRHADVAEFLPRLDPVVHSDWSEDAPISRAQYLGSGLIILPILERTHAIFKTV